MHTTTKKNLGRSTRAGVVGRSSVSSPLCARRIGHCSHARVHTRTECVWELLVCPRVLLGQRVVQTRVYQRGTLLPWTRSKLPSGTSLVQSFLLVTLPVTSTSMRYDRYDTCLHVCLRTRPSSITRECFANSDEPAKRRVEISARHSAPSSVWELFFTNASRRAKLQAYELLAYKRCETNSNGLSYVVTKRRDR